MENNQVHNMWNRFFDRIFVVHYAGHRDREPLLFNELKRVGMLDSGILQVHENIWSPLFENLMNCIRYDKDHLNKPTFSASFGHYFVMKIAEMKEYERVLVLENDICFLKDVGKILNVLENIPGDCDVGILTHFQTPCTKTENIEKYFWEIEESRKNGTMFIPYGGNSSELGSAACYSLSKRAVISLCGLYEHSLELPDMIFREQAYDQRYVKDRFHKQVLSGLRKYYSRTPICIQRIYGNSITVGIQNQKVWDKIMEAGRKINERAGIFENDYNLNYAVTEDDCDSGNSFPRPSSLSAVPAVQSPCRSPDLGFFSNYKEADSSRPLKMAAFSRPGSITGEING